MELQCTVALLEAIMARHPPEITHHITGVLHVLLPLLHSPIAAPYVHQTFLHIGTCVLQKQLHFLGKNSDANMLQIISVTKLFLLNARSLIMYIK